MSDSQAVQKPRRSQRAGGGSKTVMIRLTPEAYDELRKAAKQDSRSMANMVVYRYELGCKSESSKPQNSLTK